MKVHNSKLDTGAEAFKANRAEMLQLIDEMRGLLTRGEAISEKRRARFEERGQLTPRERLTRLLDPGLPFLELYNFANYLVDDTNPETSVPGGSVIAGIGFVGGARCMILVDDSGINAGAATSLTYEKLARCMDVTKALKLPLIHCVESAGANLLNYKLEFWALGGGVFARLAHLSAAGLPTLAVLHGPSTAGGAYMPGMSDYVIGVKGRGSAALAGQALLQAATGEVANHEELSGAEMHANITGLVEHLAEDDAEALLIARDLFDQIGWNRNVRPLPPREIKPPLYDIDEVAGLVPLDNKIPYDCRELIARIVDGSEFSDFKPRYGVSMVCAQAKVMGYPVGILANNGPIDPDGATKAGQFIQLCDQAQTPLIFLQNITGYMVGKDYEQAGMIKHGSKMIQAVANARVPKITFHCGASYGAGNYGMCGVGYDPDFLFTWPNAKLGVMGGEQAAKTMSFVARQGAKRQGKEVDEEALAQQEAKVIDHFERQSDAFYYSGRLLDHGVVDPRDTRRVIGFTLDTIMEARNRDVQPNAFGVARM